MMFPECLAASNDISLCLWNKIFRVNIIERNEFAGSIWHVGPVLTEFSVVTTMTRRDTY